MITSAILFTGFGEYCLFVYGNKLDGNPLITTLLPEDPFMQILKLVFSLNVIISISLVSFPANNIIESYVYQKFKETFLKNFLINLQRSILIALCVTICILLGNAIDKFNSIVGTITATPVVFIIPCLAHNKLCSPNKLNFWLNNLVIFIAFLVLIIGTTFTIETWNK